MPDIMYSLDDSQGHPVLDTRSRALALVTYRELIKTHPFAKPAVFVDGEYDHDASVAFDNQAFAPTAAQKGNMRI